jgi:hypothetical protein
VTAAWNDVNAGRLPYDPDGDICQDDDEWSPVPVCMLKQPSHPVSIAQSAQQNVCVLQAWSTGFVRCASSTSQRDEQRTAMHSKPKVRD